VRVHLVSHPADAPFVAELTRVMATHKFEAWPSLEGCDVAAILLSKAALCDGLGQTPAEALAAEIAVLPMVLGAEPAPRRFPAHAKHMPLARDVSGALRLLEDHRKNAATKIADGKRELFGFGLLLGLLAKGEASAKAESA
jgi:hypothetical protein